MLVRGFAPIADSRARVLILGSMPSLASLQAGEYYGHPRNAFWPLMAGFFGFAATAPYRERCDALRAAGVAVWDVLQACEREGSLDQAIAVSSEVPQPLPELLKASPEIGHVFFNGSRAAAGWRRHWERPRQALTEPLRQRLDALPTMRLPSTSPAHASLGFAEKRAAWRAVPRALRDLETGP